MSEILTIVIPAFVTLFVIVDPIAIAPIFVALTDGTSEQHRQRMAVKATLTAGIVLLVFAIGGDWLLKTLGISLAAFRVAGGAMLFLIALEMVFEKRNERRESRVEDARDDAREDVGFEDVSVFPLAVPLLAGPGAIASVMLLMNEQAGMAAGQLWVGGTVIFVLLLSFVIFLLAGPIIGVLGHGFTVVITRILGMILGAMAVQFMADGLLRLFHL